MHLIPWLLVLLSGRLLLLMLGLGLLSCDLLLVLHGRLIVTLVGLEGSLLAEWRIRHLRWLM